LIARHPRARGKALAKKKRKREQIPAGSASGLSDEFAGDIGVTVSSLGILAAASQTIGWGGAIIAVGVNVLIYGTLLELKQKESRLSRLIQRATPEWIRKRTSFSWFFFLLGLALIFVGLIGWQLGRFEIHALRKPIAQDHLTFLQAQKPLDISKYERPSTYQGALAEQTEKLLLDVVAGYQLGSEKKNPNSQTYLIRSIELTSRYLPFALEFKTLPAHKIVRAMAVQIDGKDSSTGGYTRLSGLTVQQNSNTVRIEVNRPLPDSQVALIVSVERPGDPPLDTVFERTRFLIREASP
jgi:hypothetical protein